MEYLTSVVVFPVILLAIGVFVLFFYHFIFCCFCCRCCKLVDKVSPDKEELDEGRVHRIHNSRCHTTATFFVLLLSVFVVNNVFIGYNENMTEGVHSMGDGFDIVSDRIGLIADSLLNISDTTALAHAKLTAASSSGCAVPSSVVGYINDIADTSDDLHGSVETIPDGVDDSKDNMKIYLIDYKNQIMFSAYAVVLALLLVYLICYFIKSVCLIRILVMISDLFLLGMLIISALVMIFVVR